MANGSTRIAQSNIILANKPGNTEHKELLSLSDKKSGLTKIPLKAGKSGHNHSMNDNHAK